MGPARHEMVVELGQFQGLKGVLAGKELIAAVAGQGHGDVLARVAPEQESRENGGDRQGK